MKMKRKNNPQSNKDAEAPTKHYTLDQFFQIVPDLVCIASTDGYFKKLNQAWEQTLGFTLDELLSQPFVNFIHPDDIEPTQREIEKQVNGQSTMRFINRYHTKDGAYRWLEWNATPAEGGSVLYAIARDITRQKQVEEALYRSEQDLIQSQEIARVGIWKWDIENGDITWSDEMYHIFGIDKNSHTGRLGDIIARIIHPDDLHLLLPSRAGVLAKEPIEYRIIMPDQSIRDIWAKTGEVFYNVDGKPVYLTGIAQDITERKQAEKTLLQANNRLSLAQRSAGAGVWDWDMITGLLDWSPELFHLFGLNATISPTFDVWRSVLHPEDMQIAEDRINQSIREHIPLDNVYRIVLPSQEIRWINALGNTIYNELGEPQRMSGICIDITARKQMEDALRESESFNRAILDNSPIGISVRSPKGKLLSANGAWKKLWAIPDTDVCDDIMRERQALRFNERDDYLKMHADEVRRVYEQGGHLHLPELKTTHPRPGAAEWISQHFYAIPDAQGKVARVVILTEDISERKRKEDALKASEEKFRNLVEQMGEVFYSIDTQGLIEYTSPSIQALLGFTPEELLGRKVFELIHPEDHEKVVRGLSDAIRGVDYPTEFRIVDKSGSFHWVRSSDRAVVRDGQVVGLQGICEDITERKRAEDVMKENEEKLRTVLNTMEEGLALNELIFDENGDAVDYRILEVNTAFEEISFLTREQAIGKTATEIYFMEPAQITAFWKAHQNDDHAIKSDMYIPEINKWRHISTSKIAGNKFATLFFDNTEQKNVEIALRESQERFSNAFEFAPIGMALVSPEGSLLKVNRAVCNMLGYSGDELLETSFQTITHPDDLNADQGYVEQMLCGGLTTYQMQKRYIHKSGDIVWVLLGASLVCDGKGKPQYFIHQVVNITERKKAEEALRQNEEMLRTLFDNSPIGLEIYDRQAIVRQCNRKGYEMFGMMPSNVIGKFNLRDDPNYQYPDVWERLNRGEEVRHEIAFSFDKTPYPTNKTGISYYHIITTPIPVEISPGIGYIMQILDVTERKLADEQIKKSLSEKETLLRELYHRTKNNMAVIIALLDIQSDGFDDVRLREAFADAQNRIHSMALVHQKLYESQDISRINLKDYTTDLIELMLKSYNIAPSRISIVSSMEDVFVLIDSAVPCGLVLNELISNALKYAFPNEMNGEIRIGLHRTEQGVIELDIADNGVGVPPGFDFRRDGQLGTQTLFLLAENQLQGQITFDTHQGVACKIRFQDIYYQPRI